MLGEPLASRYEGSEHVFEDKYGRHTLGRRISDGVPVVITVFDPQLKIGVSEIAAAAEVNKRLADLKMAEVLHCIEAGKTDAGNFYMVYEASPFDSLKLLLRTKNTLPLVEALEVAYKIAATLRRTAQVQVNHLDLSSSNCFVDPDTRRVRIARFGFSKLLPPYAPARKNEPFHGTPEYMAPEVCSGRPGDVAADIYALGILMYEMVAGKPPFVSASPSTTIKRQVYEKPLPLHVIKPGISGMDAYERLVSKLLAKDPKGRPSDPAEVMAEIEALCKEKFPEARLEVEPEREAKVEVRCDLVVEPPKAEVAKGPEGRETVIFTGLSAEVAAPPVERAERARVEVEVSRPTEAFDASLVEDALRAEAKATPEAQVQPTAGEPVKEAMEEKVSPVGEPAKEEPQERVEVEPRAEPSEEASRPAETGPAEVDKSKEMETARRAAEWFVEDSSELPESAFPPEDEEKKESRTFWLIVAAVGVMVIVGLVLYFESIKPPPPEPPKPVVVPAVSVPPRPVVVPDVSVAAVPDATVSPMVPPVATTPDVPKVEPAPPPQPAGPSPEEIKAQRLSEALEEAREAFKAGNLARAKDIAKEILKDDPGHEGAKTLLAEIQAKEAVPEKKPPKPKAPKEGPRPPTIEKPAAPVLSPEEVQAKVKEHIRAGRDAYNAGDYQKAISEYNKALMLDPNNALVKKLLDQAKAKAGSQ